MRTRVSFAAGWKLTWLAVLLALVLLQGTVWAGERFLVPQEMPLPLYAEGWGHTSNGEWVVGALFYPVDTLPEKANLLQRPVYEYPVGYVTPYVEGAMIFGQDPFVPEVIELHNAPGVRVPMIFTPGANWTEPTIKAMKKSGSLWGWADFYYEIVQNGDPTNPLEPWHEERVAYGFLEDGRSFKVWSSHTDTLYMTRVEFGE
jgi:hypothetical protein